MCGFYLNCLYRVINELKYFIMSLNRQTNADTEAQISLYMTY